MPDSAFSIGTRTHDPTAGSSCTPASTQMMTDGKILTGVRAVLFDFDGTLAELNIDFAAMKSGVHACMRRWGQDPLAYEQSYVLEQIEAACERLGGQAEGFRREAHAIILEIEQAAARNGRLLPGVRDLLRELRAADIRTGVLTRNCREAVLTIVPDLERLCDVFAPRDGLVHVKPHPKHLQICLARIGRSPEESVMVGDHPMDIQAGAVLGMRTVGVLTGHTTRPGFAAVDADLILPRATCLRAYLDLSLAKPC
jgi:phosphoglycolate phosphatase